MKEKQKYSSVRVDAITFEKLKFICEMLGGKSKTDFLRDLIDRLFDVSSEFKTGYIEYMPYGNVLRIQFSGKSILVSGSMPMSNAINKEVCDVAVSTVVESEFERREKNVE